MVLPALLFVLSEVSMQISLGALLLASAVLAGQEHADWPQFRGPDGQGHSVARGLPLKWSETNNISWKTPIPGLGWSSPVVAAGRIWLTTATGNGKSLRAVCVDAATGRILLDIEVFQVKDPPPINSKNSYASPTPVLDAGRLYVHYGTLGTACLDAGTGKILWTNHALRIDHREGAGSSPIICGGLLIVNCDGIDFQYVAALSKKTGKLVWKTPRSGANNKNPDFRKAYSTPLAIRVAGREQVVSTGADRASALDPETGKEIWWVDYDGFSNVPRPVFGRGRLYLCIGYFKLGVWAVRPDGKGDVTASHVVWRETKRAPANPSPLLVEDILYTVSDLGIVTARAADTGRDLGSRRLGSPVSSSPVYADGRIYICDEKGTTTVLRPGASLELLARNKLEGRIQASPAIAGRAIFLRTATHLYRAEDRSRP
jgi:outer membrane protein assembly factor BamB